MKKIMLYYNITNIMPIYKKTTKHKKTIKHKIYCNKTKRFRGGENERLSKLKDLITIILNYCYFNKFIAYNYLQKFENIPENEQVVDASGMKAVRKITGKYNFVEYMENKLPKFSPKNGNELIKTMNTSWHNSGNAYKLFPDDLFSDKYILEIDEKIKIIVDELNNMNIDDEDKHTTLFGEIHLYLFKYLYLNNMAINDIFLENVIIPEITKIYNIKDIYDIDDE
jgi:hypothetical protein